MMIIVKREFTIICFWGDRRREDAGFGDLPSPVSSPVACPWLPYTTLDRASTSIIGTFSETHATPSPPGLLAAGVAVSNPA